MRRFALICMALLFAVAAKGGDSEVDVREANAVYKAGKSDASQLDALIKFPAAISVPRLAEFLRVAGNGFPEDIVEQVKRARILIPQIPSWVEYYQRKLAEAYQETVIPEGTVLSKFSGEPEDESLAGRVFTARDKMRVITMQLAELQRPESVSLIAQYLSDQSKEFYFGDYSVPGPSGYAAIALNHYFEIQTGKYSSAYPQDWRPWWEANKGLYPELPTKQAPPTAPTPRAAADALPPATPASQSPRPFPDPVVDPERDGRRPPSASKPSLVASPPVAAVPSIRQAEVDSARWWIVGGSVVLTVSIFALILRARRG